MYFWTTTSIIVAIFSPSFKSIVQDIEAFEPMIESVKCKAEQLQQHGISPEIRSRYQNLVQDAKVLFTYNTYIYSAFLSSRKNFLFIIFCLMIVDIGLSIWD